MRAIDREAEKEGGSGEKLRRRSCPEDQSREGIDSLQIGVPRPLRSTVERESGGKGGPYQDGKERKLQIAAHEQIGATRDEPPEYGEP
jgi:hypothetical protein